MIVRVLLVTLVAAVLANGCKADKSHVDILGTQEKLYSQHDEELLIRDFFQDKRDGVFVDLGCAWPIRGSTTYYLEKHLGWSGIAIDALAEYASQWAEVRPNAKFRHYAVTDHSGDTLTFYRHGWPAVSSLSKEQAAAFGGEKNLTAIKVPTITLTDLLDAEGIEKIDHLTIDIEGAEPGALAGFDIERFKPELVCIEGGRVNGDLYLEYFGKHGYERIERYAPHDEINWYFRRVR
jgi:FkbM family methyltransferase